jgi:hypothetical protein
VHGFGERRVDHGELRVDGRRVGGLGVVAEEHLTKALVVESAEDEAHGPSGVVRQAPARHPLIAEPLEDVAQSLELLGRVVPRAEAALARELAEGLHVHEDEAPLTGLQEEAEHVGERLVGGERRQHDAPAGVGDGDVEVPQDLVPGRAGVQGHQRLDLNERPRPAAVQRQDPKSAVVHHGPPIIEHGSSRFAREEIPPTPRRRRFSCAATGSARLTDSFVRCRPRMRHFGGNG